MMGAYDMLTGAIYNEEKVKEAFKTGDVTIKTHAQFAFRKILQAIL